MESTSEYQFGKKEALEANYSWSDELDSSTDEESPPMAEEIGNRARCLVERTSRFGRVIKLSKKVLS